VDTQPDSRALDAALVPLELPVASGKTGKRVYLVMDDNPAPLAEHSLYLAEGDPRDLKLRVCASMPTPTIPHCDRCKTRTGS